MQQINHDYKVTKFTHHWLIWCAYKEDKYVHLRVLRPFCWCNCALRVASRVSLTVVKVHKVPVSFIPLDDLNLFNLICYRPKLQISAVFIHAFYFRSINFRKHPLGLLIHWYARMFVTLFTRYIFIMKQNSIGIVLIEVGLISSVRPGFRSV